MANHPTTYYVGLDLGQSQDYTALAVIQKVPTYD
jgi:phage terminase large subunit-like protein